MLSSPEKLQTLLQAVGKKLYMKKFDDKLEVQKITYLAQEYGIDLGYEFEWGRRGPYCKQVSEHARVIFDSNIDIDISLVNQRKKLQQFASIMKPHLNDTDWLEIAASLLYLKKDSYKDRELNQVIGYLVEDLTYGYKNFNETLVRRVTHEISKIGIFV